MLKTLYKKPTIMTKKTKIILFSSLGLVAILTLVLVFGKFSKRKVNADNPDFIKYVSAYTSGLISKTSTIQIKLSDELIKKLPEGQALPEDLIEFRPSIGGKCELKGNTLEFIPAKMLPSGQKYFTEFHLSKLEKVPSELENFNFEFMIIPQNFDFLIEGQKTIDKKTLSLQQVIGFVQTADFETSENIGNIFAAQQNGKKLSVKWHSDIDGTTHHFVIDSINREIKPSEVRFVWDGKKIDIDKKGEQKITIPAINDFSFIESRIIRDSEQYLQLQFTDPLDENQNLNGLITMTGDENLRFIVEDNTIKVFPSVQSDTNKTVVLYSGIKNVLGVKLKNQINITAEFEQLKPAVRLIGSGNILPSSDKGMVFPFEAVNLKAVDVTVIKIYEKNIIQFLQVNELDGENELQRVGKPLFKKTISLENKQITDFSKWNRFTLDLNTLIENDPGAIYRIEINFKKKYSLYACKDDSTEETESDLKSTGSEWDNPAEETSNWDAYQNSEYSEESYSYYDDYYTNYWENRENPCKNGYYGSQRKIAQNIIASDIGIIAKLGNNNGLNVFTADLKTTKPKDGATIEIYDYQNQLLKSAVTDKDGRADLGALENPFFVVAKLGNQRGYLKLQDGYSLSLSRFDIAGTAVSKGLKGFIYGERGVWRPGDTLFLDFMLKEDVNKIPAGHPIVFELKNPKNQVIKREIQKKNDLGIYPFFVATANDALTGNYELTVSVGSVNFFKTLKVETIKPNRLKIKLDFDEKILLQNKAISGLMNAKWLHGAIAKDLKVQIDATLKPVQTEFTKYSDFSFDDPTKEFYGQTDRIFEGTTDDKGTVPVHVELDAGQKAPGKLTAVFVTKVFEKGGDFSSDQISLPYSPYNGYVGVKIPKGDKRNMLLTDTTHQIDVVTLDPEGKPITGTHRIEMKFYKIEWRWWWDNGDSQISSYNFNNSSTLLDSKTIFSSNGKASWKIKVKYPDWGRYLVLATDMNTGHSSGKIMYIDWPGWAGHAEGGSAEDASMLMISSDKKNYTVGEEAKISIPTGKDGRALISIENGTTLLETHWLDTKQGETEYKFKVTESMTPNIYVHVTLLQPHAQTANDLPIRMYGVLPVMVENPGTHLNPVINMPDKLEAEKEVKITVSEKNNKPMTYTLAIVDEGLLDLTHFETPDAWKSFYAKEALGVKTWDLYNNVIGAYTGQLDRLLAVGGDDMEDGQGGNKKANRFKPVVIYLGPFTLNKGSNTHTVKLPKYIGSVRTMVVAGNGKAYGSAEKSTPVIKPLMILGTLPRVLSPGEKVVLPADIFAMEKDIKNVKVTVKTNGFLKIIGSNTKTVKFTEPGDEMANFELEVLQKTGVGTVQITAVSGNRTATFDIEIDVRNPNPKATNILAKILNPGETWTSTYTPLGANGTNTGTLEISSIPPVNLEKRLSYLIEYPYGCIEQTTSAVFPQLYVLDLIKIDDKQKLKIENNIKAGIKRIEQFQLANGGMSYWTGNQDVCTWGTNYAGHFLIEAEKKGYSVPQSLLKAWTKYQTAKAKSWINDGPDSQLDQAYRLYTLALYGKAETSSMNRLKESTNLSDAAKWQLAAAYFLAGKQNVAQKLVSGLQIDVKPYTYFSETFGSNFRDDAMILTTLNLLGEKSKAFSIVKLLSEEMSSNRYMSTQTTAYCLLAVSDYVKKNQLSGALNFSYAFDNGKAVKISDSKTISQNKVDIKGGGEKTISVTNNGKSIVYVQFIQQGIPATGSAQPEAQHDLYMTVSYKLPDGSSLSPESIPQGTDFIAEITVTHPGLQGTYKNMALAQIFPSGWEIINSRMLEIGYAQNSSTATYQDIRDDRVFTYFDMTKGTSKTYRVLLNASYVGEYWMAPVACEAMYDETIFARNSGKFVKVTAN
jgi:uncharacterized protein YfaS (alpha-2-macroglobulin family)